ncbi:DUF4181 domain-containing protein [Bacillus mesophilus]|uniref:DUF4181 domain-containing protein n=1 Tax=Bacillus mesophilus TaxID=1808955 RepID=A0A6M0Q5A9_9BACI|nr:DUF4181 domain-containing protein [Bacillus mesophilus]
MKRGVLLFSELLFQVIVFSIIFCVISIVIDRWIRRKLGISKGFKYEPYSSSQRSIEYGMLAVFIIVQFVMNFEYAFFSSLVFSILLLLFRIFIERKYAKNDNYHLILSIDLVFFLLYISSISILFPEFALS